MNGPTILEIENAVLRDRLNEMKRRERRLLSAVERYVEPKPGEFMHRTELLRIKNELKDTL